MKSSTGASVQERGHRLIPIRGEAIGMTRNGRCVLDVDDVEITGGGLTAVLGPNGAGKSLLLRVLSGLIAPDRGRVTWRGAPPDRIRTLDLGYVLQRPVLLRRSALANVAYPLTIRGMPAAKARVSAQEGLAAAGLAHLATAPARLLSGGEQRRLAIARALVTGPEVLFLDEPSANLDPRATADIEQMILRVRSSGTPVVLVTHDIGQARRLADRVLFMAAGRIIESAPAVSFFDAPASPEARAFLAGELVL